jgi:hypothetical protein
MKLHNTGDEGVCLEAALARYRVRLDEGAEVVTLERLSDQCTECLTLRFVIIQIFCVPRETLLRRGATVEIRPAF